MTRDGEFKSAELYQLEREREMRMTVAERFDRWKAMKYEAMAADAKHFLLRNGHVRHSGDGGTQV